MPVYNEAETVLAVLDAVRKHYDGEIIVIDDGSTDRTPHLLAARSDITLVSHPANLGYGRALAEGFALAVSRGIGHVVTMDCDGQHEPAHIPEFLEELGRGGDIVSGSRYLPDSRQLGEPPAHRREVNQRVTDRVNEVTGWGITDAFCGFKAYRLGALNGMRIEEPGYAMPLELWAKAFAAGLDVREIPVERIYHDADRSFGEMLDDPERRFGYYMDVWHQTLEEVGRG
jgi:dolichol-phosphate mannosyltransferase